MRPTKEQKEQKGTGDKTKMKRLFLELRDKAFSAIQRILNLS